MEPNNAQEFFAVFRDLPDPRTGNATVHPFPSIFAIAVCGRPRLLFLDEANRLSQDNLAVLFDLCQTLDLQLLIAAPEVALAEGNTTYRLVRLTTAEGREEVRVTGRRPRAEA